MRGWGSDDPRRTLLHALNGHVEGFRRRIARGSGPPDGVRLSGARSLMEGTLARLPSREGAADRRRSDAPETLDHCRCGAMVVRTRGRCKSRRDVASSTSWLAPALGQVTRDR